MLEEGNRGELTEKNDEPSICFDHVSKGRPLPNSQGTLWGNVSVVFDTAVREGFVEHADVYIVAVCEKDGEDLVRVRIQPGFYSTQVALYAPSIFQEAACMTQAQLLKGIQMRLALEKADAGIQLVYNGFCLVVRG